ncbi:agmatinase family protein [Desulfovibrio sp. OttesenSCG-928-C06]|nr:agmatinase family protein [Desulfovibrio sp. OttesenSCG-928-C06]
MSQSKIFLESEITPLAPEECRFHVIPVPYEATVSYGGGTRLGPQAIIEASSQLEAWTGRNLPLEHGIYTWPEVDCAGDAEKVLGNIEAAVQTALERGPQGPSPDSLRNKRVASESASDAIKSSATTNDTLAADSSSKSCCAAPCLPVALGGEHTVTLGLLRALKKRYGHFGVIQFDAHADLRNSYEGSPYSHACVMRRAVDDLGLNLFQIGVRSLSPEEVEFRKLRGIRHLDARDARFPLAGSIPGCTQGRMTDKQCEDTAKNVAGQNSGSGQGGLLDGLIPADFPELVFLTFDIDALDASLMPATGTPEPGGLFWWDALRLIEASLGGRTCIGFDVVELAPLAGLHAPNFTTARLVYEIMGMFG